MKLLVPLKFYLEDDIWYTDNVDIMFIRGEDNLYVKKKYTENLMKAAFNVFD